MQYSTNITNQIKYAQDTYRYKHIYTKKHKTHIHIHTHMHTYALKYAYVRGMYQPFKQLNTGKIHTYTYTYKISDFQYI